MRHRYENLSHKCPPATAGNGESLLRQADLLANVFQPPVAAKQGKFWVREGPAYPRGTKPGHALQSLQSPVLITQAGVDQGFLEGIWRKTRGQFFGLVTSASSCVGMSKIRPCAWPISGSKDLDSLARSPLGQPRPAQLFFFFYGDH